MSFEHLRDPRFNMRKVCQQWLLLEQHLTDPSMRCPECIAKHALTAEAYIEEAFQLDVRGEYTRVLSELSMAAKRIETAIKAELDDAASIIREERKKLQPFAWFAIEQGA